MSLPASTWSGASVRYYGEHKQTLLSVVNVRERKMLGAPFAVGTEAGCSSLMGNKSLPA